MNKPARDRDIVDAASLSRRGEMRLRPHALEISRCLSTRYTLFGWIDILLSEEEKLLGGSADCREVMLEVSSPVKTEEK